MRLKEAVHNGTEVFALEGQIDLHFAPALRSLLQAKIHAHCPALVVDLSGVTFIDSTGLSVLIEYFRDASEQGCVFCLCGLNDDIKGTFRIVRLDRTIPMFATVEDASAAVRSGSIAPPSEALFDRAE
jgi:anti-sigma B factor antagonist